VVPKALREALGLTGGQEIDVVVRDGSLEVRPASIGMRLETTDGHVVAIPDEEMPALTSAMVRETLEQSRR
jgi:AbrB family looped-hinge helix DNA binding protein